jgi:hypothetical protein
VKIGFIFFLNVDTLAWLLKKKKKIGGKLNPYVNYFVKIRPNKYHKIVIPAPHWS